jgi:hypothetical protein
VGLRRLAHFISSTSGNERWARVGYEVVLAMCGLIAALMPVLSLVTE